MPICLRLAKIDDDNVTSGCCINQHTGQVVWNKSTKTPWHDMFPRVCPPSGGNNQPYSGDAQCTGGTPIAIRTDNVPKKECLQSYKNCRYSVWGTLLTFAMPSVNSCL